jgi:hypothetical protein
MSSRLVRRLIVWGVSMGLGALTAWLIITLFLPAASPSPNAEAVSIADYGIQYFFWTAFPLGLVFLTILDGFLDTRIWPD